MDFLWASCMFIADISHNNRVDLVTGTLYRDEKYLWRNFKGFCENRCSLCWAHKKSCCCFCWRFLDAFVVSVLDGCLRVTNAVVACFLNKADFLRKRLFNTITEGSVFLLAVTVVGGVIAMWSLSACKIIKVITGQQRQSLVGLLLNFRLAHHSFYSSSIHEAS